MLNKRRLLASALAAMALPAVACAQVAPPAEKKADAAPAAVVKNDADADPAMWVVKDQDTTIYMLGTFHMLDGKQEWFNDEVKAAFDKSQEVVLEAKIPENQADLQPLVMKYAVDPQKRTLTSKLTPTVKAKLDKELAGVGAPAAAFDMFEPWFVSMTLVTLGAQKLGLSGEHGPEAIITKAAKTRGMPVTELEGFDMQLSMFDKMPEAQQIKFLDTTLDSMSKLEGTLQPMRMAWASGETEQLVAMMNESMKDEPELNRIIFTDRNAKWAEWIDQRMDKPGVVFMAVGAGHLAGKDSVADFLSKRGIKVSRFKG